jgi:sucrose phosphorylase
MMAEHAAVKKILERIYGEADGEIAYQRVISLVERSPIKESKKGGYFSQEDVVLITYGDSLLKEGEAPLVTLHNFANTHLKGAISNIHFLPFFPYSSDDGFSVQDFHAINPDLGSWDDVVAIGSDFELMFDYVVNHFSSKGEWFANYLAGKEGFVDLAIEVDPSTDLSQVTRPRSLPLLSKYKKHDGSTVHLWTTFSADQIDFNFKSLDVLEEIGTNCIHLPQTHDMVKLFRAVLDLVAPDVIILTETNVPHDENISYFGNGRDEAQMVYNFTLPPLLFYTFVKEDSTALSEWARGLELESESNTFFNFTASHDGIGVRPLEGILSPSEIDGLIEIVTENNGQVSYKRNPDGSDSPYELNITYVDAILGDPDSKKTERFLASQAIQYVVPGVPATYIHSLLGSRNWLEGVKETGRARTINRAKLQVEEVLSELNDPDSFRSKVFFPYLDLIKVRKQQRAFHPNAGFEILEIDSKLFAIKRYSEDQTIYALTNISSQDVPVSLKGHDIAERVRDLITGEKIGTESFSLMPYQFVWLSPADA